MTTVKAIAEGHEANNHMRSEILMVKAMTLTQSAEWVSSQASQSVATRCIHDPVQQVTLPA